MRASAVSDQTILFATAGFEPVLADYGDQLEITGFHRLGLGVGGVFVVGPAIAHW